MQDLQGRQVCFFGLFSSPLSSLSIVETRLTQTLIRLLSFSCHSLFLSLKHSLFHFNHLLPPTLSPSAQHTRRQWLPATGPEWTSLRALAAEGHKNEITQVEANVYSILTTPKVGIGQRCLLLLQDLEAGGGAGGEAGEGAGGEGGRRGRAVGDRGGNILWDCSAFLDEATIEAVNALGGVQHIILSHPHFLGSCVTWSKAFEDAPIYLHDSDKKWVTRPDDRYDEKEPRYLFWEGDINTFRRDPSVRVQRLGGHFPSSSVLLLESSAQDGKGIVFTGDTILPVPHGRWCSFMYSFPNLLPLPAFVVEEIRAKVQKMPAFDRLYGPFSTSAIIGDAKEAVLESAQRYLDSLAGIYHGK